MIPTEKPTTCIDSIVRGAAEEDRKAGLIPNVNAHRAFVQDIVERMDRKDAESPARPTSVSSDSATQISQELARSDDADSVLGGEVRVERRAVSDAVTKVRTKGTELLAKRIRLLNSKPDWAIKLQAINPLTLNGVHGSDKQRHAEELVRQVIRDSDRVFGPWWKEAPRPIWDSGQTKRG